MSSIQFVEKAEAQSGDRVREVGSSLHMDRMPVVVRRIEGAGAVVFDGRGERFVANEDIDAVLRLIFIP